MTMTTSIRTLVRRMLFGVGLSALSLPALAAVSSSAPVASGVTMKSTRSGTETLPLAVRPVFYRALAKDAGVAYKLDSNGCATLPKRGLKGCFDSGGAHFTDAASPLALCLTAWGRGDSLSPVKPVKPTIQGNHVSYSHGNLSEWWRVLPMGFEQGFTIATRPSGQGELTLALAVSYQTAGDPGNKVEQGQGTLGWGKLRYGKLVVTDANGKVIPATLTSKGNRILIAVNDANAAYPLTVDPLVWLEQKAVSDDGAASDRFGYSVALGGTTAIIGAPFADVNGNADQGAVYVFTQVSGVWIQSQKLTESDGTRGDKFGQTVAISGDTVLVGSPDATVNGVTAQGAAYVFNNLGDTWTQAQKLTADDGDEFGTFGQGVALDGTTAFIAAGDTEVIIQGGGSTTVPFPPSKKEFSSGQGDPLQALSDASPNYFVPGSVYVFEQSQDGTWEQTQKIDSPYPADADARFGFYMDMSGDHVAVSAYRALDGQGAVNVYAESDGTWSLEQQLTGSDSQPGDLFGTGVAIDGTTILVGAQHAEDSEGEAYVFAESGGNWLQTQILSPSDGAPGYGFGSDVALDGTTALIGSDVYLGGEGKTYLYVKSNGTWAEKQGFVPSDYVNGSGFTAFGFSVALSGATALVSASVETVDGHDYQGAAYFYDKSDLGLAVSAPQTVGQNQQYVSQTIATNSDAVASPAVSATITVPAAASFVSATATQGSCSEDSGVVTCAFGQIGGNAGTATANVTLKAAGAPGTMIENTASVAKAMPALTASAATEITSPGNCATGYTEFSGHLDAGETFTSAPITVTEAGQKYADLTSPASFAFFAITDTRYGQHTYVYPHVKHGHRWGAAGTYQVGVQAGPDAGGDYTLCVNLNPAQ